MSRLFVFCILVVVLASCTADKCHMKMDYGPCDGAFPRYYYDATAGECKQFSYGGCGGNANNFHTKPECIAACN